MHFSSFAFLTLTSVVSANVGSPPGSNTPFKKYKTANGVTYSYLSHAPTNISKPTILFLHGFPDSAHGWDYQLDYFSSRGYGFIAPDLLGYGGALPFPNFLNQR
jgi:pimeloyl-ACP methyl ester carboxylesterase